MSLGYRVSGSRYIPISINTDGSINIVDVTGTTTSTTISGDNTPVTTTILPPTAECGICLWGLSGGFTGGSATKLLTIKDGNTIVEQIVVKDSLNENRRVPLKISAGSNLVVSLEASGTIGVVGHVTVRYSEK